MYARTVSRKYTHSAILRAVAVDFKEVLCEIELTANEDKQRG